LEKKGAAMNFLRKKRVFVLLLIGFLILLFYNNHWLGQWMYPIHYKEDIEFYAEHYQIDPFLTASIIRTESNFRPNHVSKKGALGLMQIMPQTAEWIIEQGRFKDLTQEDLLREDVNLQLGSWYIAWLYQNFKFTDTSLEDDELAILTASYNAGPGNVQKWLKEGTWDGTYASIKDIPYGETRHYIQRVIYYYNKYDTYYELN
jgi:soluble lytic murein transglycosylase